MKKLSFRLWVEAEQPAQKTVNYYYRALGLPVGLHKQADAYQLLEDAYKKAGENPEAKEAYVAVHKFLDKHRGGRHFDGFFSDVTSGKAAYVPQAEHQPEFDMAEHEPYTAVRSQYHGNFDKHIKTSIPTFGEMQDKKGHAIARAFGDQEVDMLDIGGSEGSFARTISHLTNGKVRTDIVDPNTPMANFYKSKGETPGSRYIDAAFMQGWMNDDGSKVPGYSHETTDKRYDIIHETMVFQFISNARDAQVAAVKKLLKPGGLFVTEQKFKADPETWAANEKFKDTHHKDKYYSKDALAVKDKVVAFAAEKKPELAQDEAESEAVGMVNNMVHADEYEKVLLHHFREAHQYWDSGNFRGYAASDDSTMLSKFLGAVGNVNSKFSTRQTPRQVTTSEGFMTYKEWAAKHGHAAAKKHLRGHLPHQDELDRMTHKEIGEKFAARIKLAARDLGIDVEDADLDDLIDRVCGLDDHPEFHDDHAKLHL